MTLITSLLATLHPYCTPAFIFYAVTRMNFWEYKSDCQIISHVLEKASTLDLSQRRHLIWRPQETVLLEIISLQLQSVMDVIMVSNSQTHAARKSQLMSRASLSPRSQSCSRPLSHRSKNKFQGWALAGQEHTSGCVASWCLAGVSPRPALLLLQTAWRSGSTLGRTRPSKTCSKPGTGFICSCVWSESQGCPLQVSEQLLDKARSANLVHTYYNRSRVYS